MTKQSTDDRRRKLEALTNDADPEIAMKAMDMLNKLDGAYKAEVDTRPVVLLANFKMEDGRYVQDGEAVPVTEFKAVTIDVPVSDSE